MTKKEAINIMREGRKVTHSYFGDNEWMTFIPKTDTILLEDGIIIYFNDFFNLRTTSGWEDGYTDLGECEEIKPHSKERRHEIYKEILLIYKRNVEKGIKLGLCSYITSVLGYFPNFRIDSFEELMRRVPEEVYYNYMGFPTNDTSQFWFPLEDTESRIKLLEEVIKETA